MGNGSPGARRKDHPRRSALYANFGYGRHLGSVPRRHDILFLGGIVNYAITHNKIFRDYVVNYTNAPVILREDLLDPEVNEGVWSGWDEAAKKYDPETWLYEGSGSKKDAGGQTPGHQDAGGGHGKDRGGEAANEQQYHSDLTLEHPRCVYQVMKRPFAR